MIDSIVKQVLAPVRHALNASYGLLYAITFVVLFVLLWSVKGCAKLFRGYFYFAYQWQPTGRAKPRYDVTPAFDAGVTAGLLIMASVYAVLSF